MIQKRSNPFRFSLESPRGTSSARASETPHPASKLVSRQAFLKREDLSLRVRVSAPRRSFARGLPSPLILLARPLTEHAARGGGAWGQCTSALCRVVLTRRRRRVSCCELRTARHGGYEVGDSVLELPWRRLAFLASSCPTAGMGMHLVLTSSPALFHSFFFATTHTHPPSTALQTPPCTTRTPTQ